MRSLYTLVFIIGAAAIACAGGCGVLGSDDVTWSRCGPLFQTDLLAAPQKDPPPDLEVLVLRGLGNTYSLGLDELNSQLVNRSVNSTIVEWPRWQESGDRIMSETASRGSPGELVFVGHSYGADDAIRLAKYLEPRGINVKLLILLDASQGPPIPANVERVIHYYIPTYFGDNWPDVFAGNPLVPEPGNTRTIIENRYARAENLGEAAWCTNHFNIDAVVPMQQVVVQDILDVGP